MYITSIPNRKSPPCILLRESFREGDRVHKRTLANLTKWPPHIVEGLRALLKGAAVVENFKDSFKVVRSLAHGHIAAVLGTLRKVGLEQIIDRKNCKERRMVIAMIVSRIISPMSKLANARALHNETAFSSLAEECELARVDEDDLYSAMDWLLSRQDSIEKRLAERHLCNGSIVLYDITSSYYEGKKCELAQFGHNRDKKKGKRQIVYGLLCDLEGRPIAIKIFKGNTGDPSTLNTQIQKIRERFQLKRVILVGDRGLITEARLREDIKPVEGLAWITALRAPAIKQLVEQGNLQLSLFDERDLGEITSPDYPGERLIVCRNPLLAEERRKKREELLQATEKQLEKVVKATERKRRPLRGKGKIGIRVGKVLNRYKMQKHFNITIEYNAFWYERNNEKIRKEAAIDGVYIIRTSVSKEILSDEKTVSVYKKLSLVERAFRSLKTVDLKIRPINHRLPERVCSHALICMLAYYVEWHMREVLAPLLFDDHEKAIAEGLRSSVVSPAKRSPAAKKKAARKRTEDGLPVHSFETLLKDLATVVKDRIQPNIPGSPTFEKITERTPLQERVFNLLGIRI